MKENNSRKTKRKTNRGNATEALKQPNEEKYICGNL